LLRDRDNWGTTVCEHSDTVASFAEASALALLHGSPQAQHNAILIAHPLGATTLCRAGGAVGLAMRSRLIETVEFLRDTTNAETS